METEDFVKVSTLRKDVERDVDRHRIQRLLVCGIDRLGAGREEVERVRFEFTMEGIEILRVTG